MSISFLNLTNSPKIKDADWLENCFMLSSASMPQAVYKAMLFSPAHYKFSDTRIGGNLSINNPPAYTRFADPKTSGINAKNVRGTTPAGLGMYWSEQIDDPSQVIHMQFGVPTFRGMLSFFSSVGNIEAGILARTGRVPITFFIGKVIGFVVGLRLLPFILVGKVLSFLIGRSGSKYYNFKPAMHPYWNRVNFIANSIAISEGIVDSGYGATSEQKLGGAVSGKGAAGFEKAAADSGTALQPSNVSGDQALMRAAHAAVPELFHPKGGVDVYRIAMRYTELANARRAFIEELAKATDADSFVERLIKDTYARSYDVQNPTDIFQLQKIHDSEFADLSHDGGGKDGSSDAFAAAAAAETKKALSTAIATDTVTAQEANAAPVTPPPADPALAAGSAPPPAPPEGETTGDRSYVPLDAHLMTGEDGKPKVTEGWFQKWWKDSSSDIGAGYGGAWSWAIFKVNATGSTSASFSNSTGTPEIKSAINSFSSSAAKLRFNFSQGAVGIPGIDKIVSGIKNAALGFASGVELGGLVNLAGTSFIDVPDMWEDSSANMPTESYDIHLRTPYGNALSRYMNLHIPLSMLLAGALPISTGRQSYASPFICQLYSVGHSATKLGMIDSMSVTTGVGNVGYNKQMKPLGIDVSFSVKDLNRSVHAPIDTGGSLLNPLNALSIFDDDNTFNEYINVISAMSVADMSMKQRRAGREAKLKIMEYSSAFSSSHMALAVSESAPGRVLRGMGSLGGLINPKISPGFANIS